MCLKLLHHGAQGTAKVYAERNSCIYRGFDSRRMFFEHSASGLVIVGNDEETMHLLKTAIAWLNKSAMCRMPCLKMDTVHQAYKPKDFFPFICTSTQVFDRIGHISDCKRN